MSETSTLWNASLSELLWTSEIPLYGTPLSQSLSGRLRRPLYGTPLSQGLSGRLRRPLYGMCLSQGCAHLLRWPVYGMWSSLNKLTSTLLWASLVTQLVKNLPAMWEAWVGKIPWRREQLATHSSILENSMGRGAWRDIVHGVAKSWTGLSDFYFHFTVAHSRILSWVKQRTLTWRLLRGTHLRPGTWPSHRLHFLATLSCTRYGEELYV